MRDTDPDAVQSPQGLPPAPPGFRRAPSGGLLRAPWPRGQSGNPSGYGTVGEYHRTVSLARQHSAEAMSKLIELIDHDDPRIAMLASQAVLERAWGRVKEADPNASQPRSVIDLSRLAPHELEILMRLAKTGAIRPATDDPVGTVRDAEVETIQA
jgi:hypothetical protein